MSNYYPPVGFFFNVKFEDLESQSGDSEFQSVSGLSVDIETEEIAEGGENRFKHKFPVKTKYPNLVLKRGLIVNTKLIKWCRNAIENFEFKPVNLTVSLMNEKVPEGNPEGEPKREPLMSWNVVHAIPVKWSVDDLNAEESKMVIESIELSYNYFKTIPNNAD
ncbi:phage tail protein [Echinicola jeungdonensis]|uniref:Phage tail protein n=1 Tax=Echinicola jeungdonensis TaxID=709343 RepID=A0ABV5J6U2_9BACT|nr:phage tail protein [Echinicola jeungdonensis]MDN3670822.1 phage tail protein [Echinicola jeungdonensis]